MRRRIVSLAMAVVMVLSMLPTAAWAELAPELNEALAEETTVSGGEQGENAQPEQEKQDSEGGENGIALLANGSAVAEADGKKFETLQAAFDYATNEAPSFPTIKLLDNVTLDSYVYMDTGCSAALDLNGKTVSRQPNTTATGGKNDSVFLVESGAALTIKDTAGGGQIVQPNIYAAVTANGGTVTIEGGTIKATSTDAENNRAIEVISGTVTINGGTIEGAQIGVRVWGGSKLIVNGGTIRGGESYALLTSGAVELSGGTFTTSAADGYSVWNENGTAESLLASAGYAYTTETGARSAFSDDERGVVGNTTVAEIPESVSYIGADGTVQSCAEYEKVVTDGNNVLTERWYVVKENAEVFTLYLNGYNSTTNLILCDGATLTATYADAIQIENVTLNIYLQSGGTGKLVVKGGITHAGELPTVNRVGTPMKLVNEAGKATSSLTSYFEISKCDHSKVDYKSDATYHAGACDYCGTFVQGKHTFGAWTYKDADTHTGTCKVCGYESTVKHEMRYTDNEDGLTHKSFCRDCDLTAVNEKHRFYNGKCLDCGAQPAAQVGDQIYTSLPIALDAAEDGGTVKLLANVQLDKPLSIEADGSNGYRNFLTLDLNGKTISCTGIDNATVYNSITLTICDSSSDKTGAITQNGLYAVQSGQGGKLTITGGAFGSVGIFGDGVISGGTFSEIWVFDVVSNPEKLNTVLKDGYAFANSDGSIVNGYESTNAKNVTVVEHSHSGASCACGYTCDHSQMESTTGNCASCGEPVAQASVTAGDITVYYRELTNAITAAAESTDPTVTLLQNVTLPDEENIYIGTDFRRDYNLTIDWNGHILSGNISSNLLVITQRANVTLKDSGGSNAGGVRNEYASLGYVGGIAVCVSVQGGYCVTIEGGTYSAQVLKLDCSGDLKIKGGVFENPANANTSYAIFSCDRNRDDKGALADLLVDGYTFAYDESGTELLNVYETAHTDKGKTVYVVAHTHTFETTGKCACGKPCAHTLDDDGTCTNCGARFVAQVGGSDYYTAVTEALSTVDSGAAVTLLTDITENVTFDGGEKSVTLVMNGKTLTAKDKGSSALTVTSGTLTISGNAAISNPEIYNISEPREPAITVSGGKLVFTDKLVAKGGAFVLSGNTTRQAFAVNATGGELDFQGNIDLEGGLKITGSAALTRKLTQGTFRKSYNVSTSVSVEGSENYKNLEALLEDGYAFVDPDPDTTRKYPCIGDSNRIWAASTVTIETHEHTWAPEGELYECTECGKDCAHLGGYKTGKCEVCGKPCPHAIADQSPADHNYYCNDCGQQMFARIQTDTYQWSHFANLPDALAAAEDGQTVLLLSDINNDNRRAILTGDNKTAVLDLNGKTVTGGWIQIGYENWNDQTSSRLNITGSGSFTGYLGIGYTATADLSSWTGGTISTVSVSNNGSAGVDGKLIVGENAGTIGTLGLYSRRTASISSELSGGTYGSIACSLSDNTLSVSYSDMLAEGYAFQYVDSGEYVAYGKKASYSDYDSRSIENVKVVECPHTPETVTGTDGRCACGQVQYEAQITGDGGSTIYRTLTEAVAALQDGDTLKLLSHVNVTAADGAWEGLTIDKSITFDLNGKTLSSSGEHMINGILRIKGGTVTVKNGTVKASGNDTSAIRADSETILENVTTAIVDCGLGSVTACAPVTIKSGDYQGLYVSEGSRAVLEGGTFRPCRDTSTRGDINSIFWKVNPNTDVTSRDCMELLGEGYGYVDASGNPVRTFGGFRQVVTVKKDAVVADPVAKIGETEYTGLHSAMKAAKSGETVTLLTDLNLGNGAVLLLNDITTGFTIDLDGHTLSADGSFLVHTYDRNSSRVTLKNGTLDGSKCTGSGGAILIANRYDTGELTLENVTAKSGTMTDWMGKVVPVPVVNVTGGTAVFNGGSYTGGVLISRGNMVLNSGTFQKGDNTYSIQTKVSDKTLADYLGEDSQFWKNDALLDLSSVTETADEATVRPCEHKWENGKCTICQKVCDHGSADGKSMTSDPCSICGMEAAAQVDITGSATKYFPSFTDALTCATQNDGCTLKLLADVIDVTVNTDKSFIFDLNGRKVYRLNVSSRITLKDSTGGAGKITEWLTVPSGMSVGDLLEEGYAFKKSDGTWPAGTEQAVGGVSIRPVPITSVTLEALNKENNTTAATTMEYGTTGGVKLSASCNILDTTLPDCNWYEVGGSLIPIDNATGMNYVLPDDLPVGTYTYRVTFTSDGYSKSADITITVTPISLAGATVTVKNPTYNGAAQKPTVTVTLGETVLTENKDYTLTGAEQTNAGSYKLTVAGKGGYNGKIENVEWKIEPMKIDSVMASSGIFKVYDGTAEINMTAEEWANVLTFKTLSASGVVDVPSSAYTISDAYFVEKSGEETVHSPDAGEKYGITFKITLKSSNYVLQTYGEDTPATSKEITQSGGATFAIAKAAAPTNIQNGALNVINGTKLEYTYDATQLLPDAPKGDYGRVTYDCLFPFDLENGYSVGINDIGIGYGVLTLTIDARNGEKTGKIGTITVRVPTRNYENFNLLIDLYAVDKITPVLDGDVTASEITYGDELNKSTISGKMKDPDTGDEVKGTFAWTDGTVKPNAGGYEAEWTFTPATGYEEYATATGKVAVKVNKAASTCTAPTANDLTYTGKEQPLLTAGNTQGGTMMYRLGDSGEFVDGIPTGTNAGTYTVWYKVIGDKNHSDTAAQSVTVTLKQRDIAGAEIVLGETLTYNGAEQTQSIASVTVDGLNVTYDVNGNTGTNAGNYTLTVTGNGNFIGTGSKDFTIARKDIRDAEIVLGDSLTYNGVEQTQTIKSVTVDGLAVNYTVAGNTGTDAKTYTMTVTGTGNFTGSKTQEFTIARKDISGAKITLGESLTYNGTEQTQTIKSVTVDGLNVTYNVTGDKRTAAGNYTLTVTGTGNFTGIASKDFTIAPKNIAGAEITLGKSLTYNGAEQTQTIKSVTVDGLDVTYDVTGNTGTDAKTYTMKLTGTGNFTGTASKDFAIARKDIRDAVVDMNAPVYNGKVQAPVISAVRVDSMVLTAGTDYTAVLKDAVSAGSYSVQLTGMGNFTGTAERRFVIGKAAAPAVAPIRVDVTNDYEADYTVDLRAALNAVLPKGCSFGTVQYGAAQYSDAAGYCDSARSAISGQGILTLAVNKVSGGTEGHAATVTVTVTTANYQDITVTVELYAVNKAVPTGTPSLSRNRLSYGETLSAIRLWGGMRSGNAWVSGTFAWAEPNLRPASGTYKAEWVFTPTDDKYASVTGTVDITVAEPPVTVPTYKVGGIVKSFSVTEGTPGGAIGDAVVTIRKGLEVLGGQKITDQDGVFDLSGVTAGVYNVVVEYQGKTVTTKVEIVDHDVQLEVLISVEDVNSQLEIKDPTALTNNVVVGGLDKEAGKHFTEGGALPGGGSVSVSMDIQERAADRNDDAQNAIRKELAGKSLQFISMDMTLVKNGVEQPLTETSTVLEIILCYNTGRRNITLARYAVNAEGEGTAEKLTEADTRADGTFYIDKANGSIHIFTSRMSTYAIGYTSYSGGSSQPVESAETGDIGLLPYAAMTLSACTGVVVLRFRRKRED